RHRLQSRQRVLREPAARVLARVHAAAAVPGRGSRRLHGQRRARARPRRPEGPPRIGLRRGHRTTRRRRLALPRLPPRRRRRLRGGGRRRGTLAPMATKKQRRRREKGRRHDYEFVYVDQEGEEVEVDEPGQEPKEERKPTSGIKPTPATRAKQGAGAKP